MSNPYTSGAQKVIPAVLLYAFRGHEVLMLHARPKDGLPGKWNGLGGKLDSGETPLEAAVREFEEEASCKTEPAQWRWLGQLYFPNFKPHRQEDWWVNVYLTDLTPEQAAMIPLRDPLQPEGELHFVPFSRVLCLDLWDGDAKFLPLVFERKPFQGTLFYESGHCVRAELTLLTP
jgi:8-oxo-dGTP diphosphatase